MHSLCLHSIKYRVYLPSIVYIKLLRICHLQFIPLIPPYRDGGRFKRIPVYTNSSGGYGFPSPFEFDCLLSLVLQIYYATKTMEKHNPELETMLRYLAFHVDRGCQQLNYTSCTVYNIMCTVYCRILFLGNVQGAVWGLRCILIPNFLL